MLICIIDDHLLITQFLKRIITETYPGVIVKTYQRVNDFLAESFTVSKPDLVICDVIFPGQNGLQILIDELLLYPDTRFLVLSGVTDIAMVKLAMQHGFSGYITKEASQDEILAGIKTILNGEQFVSDALKNKLVREIFLGEVVDYHLSTREKDVLHKICSGNTPKEIAYELNLSVHTVQQYIKNIMSKFKVKRTTDLVVFAIKKRLYNPDL